MRPRENAAELAVLGEGTVAVTFELPATVVADQVAVVGDFNGWDPATHPLARGHDGTWRLSVQLARHRRYEFRYLLDGARWADDWSAGERVPSRSGGLNSVLRT